MKKIIVFKTPTVMVHVTDPLVKSQLFNIWVLASEVVITAVRAGEGNMNPLKVSYGVIIHHGGGLETNLHSSFLKYFKYLFLGLGYLIRKWGWNYM